MFVELVAGTRSGVMQFRMQPRLLVPGAVCRDRGEGDLKTRNRLLQHPPICSVGGVPQPPFPKTLRQFQSEFASEEACQQYLAGCRWPDGFVCPQCGHGRAYELVKQRRRQCAKCRYQVSLTAGTVLHRTKIPLTQGQHDVAVSHPERSTWFDDLHGRSQKLHGSRGSWVQACRTRPAPSLGVAQRRGFGCPTC